MEQCSVYAACREEIAVYKWIESEKAGYDLGDVAARRWVQHHWNGYLRARWIEHIRGVRFWVELDRGDFGLFKDRFADCKPLFDKIWRLPDIAEDQDVLARP